jgi:antitoxin component of MazEF toxin-antitoxin module
VVRKVFKSGNSLVVTLPPEVRDLGIAEDSEVDVVIEEGRVVIRPTTGISRELLEWTDTFIERNRELLKRLA